MLFACAMPLRETGGKAIDLGIVMDLIAENGHRKWAYRAQMVTAVTALVLLGMQAEPALAAKPLNLIDLFAGPQGPHAGAQAGKFPRQKPPRAEADGEPPAATAQPSEPEKPAEQAAPATP